MGRRVWAACALLALATGCRRHAGGKVALLQEILASRNDNDPRLDSAFNALSPADKDAFRALYRRIPPERRNERGTIAYLLGKNLAGPADWAFLREVVAEPRCMSLSDCSRLPRAGGEPEDVGDAVTLAYPALVALKRAQAALEKDPKNAGALSVLEAAKGSQAPAVRRLVERLETTKGR